MFRGLVLVRVNPWGWSEPTPKIPPQLQCSTQRTSRRELIFDKFLFPSKYPLMDQKNISNISLKNISKNTHPFRKCFESQKSLDFQKNIFSTIVQVEGGFLNSQAIFVLMVSENPANSPVEVGSQFISLFTSVFIHPRWSMSRISAPSTVLVPWQKLPSNWDPLFSGWWF